MTPFKVILSPCLFELMSKTESESTEMAHLTHLQSILDYLIGLNIEFDLYENAPYYPDASRRPPISRYHYFDISCSQLYAKIQKKIAYENYISLKAYDAAEIVSEYIYPDESETKDSFLRYTTYLSYNSIRALLFIGQPNSNKPRPIIFMLPNDNRAEMMPIYNPHTDCSGQLCFVLPTTNESTLFPNGSLCCGLNDDYMANRHTMDRKSLIKKYGREAASRNGYIINPRLSSINSQKQGSDRDVFLRLYKTPTYLSLDFESGGFEVFDHTGTHLGQFSFAGIQVRPAEPQTHKLYFS